MKRTSIAIALCVGLAAVIGCGGGSDEPETFKIKVAHQLTENTHLHKGLVQFCDRLEELSEGRIQPTLYAGGQLGDSRSLIEQLRIGTVHIASTAISVLSGYDAKMMLPDLPFLFETHEEAERVLDGAIGERMAVDLPDKAGIRVLSYWVSGFRSVFARERLVREPADLEGLKIRVMETPLHQDTFSMLGAVATPISFGELYVSLEQGVVDAAENDADAFYSQNFYEICKKFSLTNHSYTAVPLVASDKFYRALPEELQAALRQASAEARDYERAVAREMNDQALGKLRAAGVEIVDVSAAPFRAKLKPLHDKYRDKIGAELFDAAQNELGRL